MLTKLKRPPEVLFKRTTEMSEQEYDERTNYQMTKQDREYMRIWDLVIDVEKGVKEAPERYEHWLKPRFRLKADFQKFVEDLIDQE